MKQFHVLISIRVGRAPGAPKNKKKLFFFVSLVVSSFGPRKQENTNKNFFEPPLYPWEVKTRLNFQKNRTLHRVDEVF